MLESLQLYIIFLQKKNLRLLPHTQLNSLHNVSSMHNRICLAKCIFTRIISTNNFFIIYLYLPSAHKTLCYNKHFNSKTFPIVSEWFYLRNVYTESIVFAALLQSRISSKAYHIFLVFTIINIEVYYIIVSVCLYIFCDEY